MNTLGIESSEEETNSDQNMKEFCLLNLKLDQNIQVKISNKHRYIWLHECILSEIKIFESSFIGDYNPYKY